MRAALVCLLVSVSVVVSQREWQSHDDREERSRHNAHLAKYSESNAMPEAVPGQPEEHSRESVGDPMYFGATGNDPFNKKMEVGSESSQGSGRFCRDDEISCYGAKLCVNINLVCDGKVDCPRGDDEEGCDSSRPSSHRNPYDPQSSPEQSNYNPRPDHSGPISIKIYDPPQSMPVGSDVVFRCRNDGNTAPVEWRRQDNRPFSSNTEMKGDRSECRLTIISIRPEDAGVFICTPKGYPQGNSYENITSLTVTGSDSGHLISSTYSPPTRPPTRPPWRPDPPVTPRSPFLCRSGEIPCLSSEQCIQKEKFCDSFSDCPDNSDEAHCSIDPACNEREFQCNNKRCVAKAKRCNSADDCGDGSDEAHCSTDSQCRFDQFQCRNRRQCLPYAYLCDNYPDCDDQSDEETCATVNFIGSGPQSRQVTGGETVTLDCRVTGNPLPAIKWRFNYEVVRNSPKVTYCFDCHGYDCDSSTSTIAIRSITRAEQGYWMCEANGVLSPHYFYVSVN